MNAASKVIVLVAAALLSGCGRTAQTKAVAQCATCHQKIAETYKHVAMSQAFSLASKVSTDAATFNHVASKRRYEVVKRDGKLFQRRIDMEDDNNTFELEATHVVGSGRHARTFLHRSSNGEFTELPLTWYAQTKGWSMSPGFDVAAPPDFTRVVDDRCLFCHNGYPAADGTLASGIDCERCHGPGERHAELASQGKDAKEAIVNPKRLDAVRQLDVCQQCHLETTSAELPSMVRRFNRTVNSFRPGELLSDYVVHFDDSRSEKFEVVSHAYRMRQSACFLKSEGKLRCTTCHDPHSATTEYRAQCRSCHASIKSSTHPSLETSNCVECHMPKRQTSDAVHVMMTDHKIQREPSSQQPNNPGGKPVPYFALSERDRDLYLGVALIANGAEVRSGIAMIERQQDVPAKAVAVAGEGYLRDGQPVKAVEVLNRALVKEANSPKTRYNLGRALEAAGKLDEARAAYEQASTLPEAESALGLLLLKRGDASGAEAHFTAALRLRPIYPDALSNLGSLHADQGNHKAARKELQLALQIDPTFASAHNNLGRVLVAQGQLPQALMHLRRAVALDPNNPQSRFNLARVLQATDAMPAAIAEYRKLLASSPNFVEAHMAFGQALGDAGRLDEAIAEFRTVLRLRPGHPEAQKNLAMALEMKAR